ncbi:MAG: formyltransferase family protein, partial [Candidatus Cloacimonetes bacterium]|nr:formyltransferase family protein [Candidatus Cloacimonadota bacterium]
MAGTKPETYQIMVLSSGNSRGSNLAAMHRFFTMQEIPVRIALVVYTKRSAPIAGLCASLGIPALWISSKDPEAFERQVLHQVMTGDISLIALAGFLKQLSAGFISQLGNIPILNIHPALLPDFGGKGMYGHRVHESVFNSKEQFSGATIHKVDP